jgi:hypothetical protein
VRVLHAVQLMYLPILYGLAYTATHFAQTAAHPHTTALAIHVVCWILQVLATLPRSRSLLFAVLQVTEPLSSLSLSPLVPGPRPRREACACARGQLCAVYVVQTSMRSSQ